MNPRTLVVCGTLALVPMMRGLGQDAAPKAATAGTLKGGPVDQSKAEAVLKESPRHGEWIDVPMPAGGDAGAGGAGGAAAASAIKTWVVYPERADKAPVVIVIHEIFGMTDWVRATADQLAADGFIAVAPDLLSGKGPGGGATDSMAGDKVREAIRTLTPDEVGARLNAVRAHALKFPAAAPRAACIGFCWGGSQSFRYAAMKDDAGADLSGAVVFYGTAPMKDERPDAETLARVRCPVLGHYGGNDARVTATVEATTRAMRDLHKTYEPHVYEGAGHGFVRQQNSTANTQAAKESWDRTIEFLKKNLER